MKGFGRKANASQLHSAINRKSSNLYFLLIFHIVRLWLCSVSQNVAMKGEEGEEEGGGEFSCHVSFISPGLCIGLNTKELKMGKHALILCE